MAFIDGITPLLITYDEIQNIERTLAKLAWARRIVAIDSGSTDGTFEVLARTPGVEVHHRVSTASPSSAILACRW